MSQATLSPVLQDSLCREDAAAYIGVEVSTMAGWANSGRFRDILPFAKIGKRAFYKRADLDRWIEYQFSTSSGQR